MTSSNLSKKRGLEMILNNCDHSTEHPGICCVKDLAGPISHTTHQHYDTDVITSSFHNRGSER